MAWAVVVSAKSSTSIGSVGPWFAPLAGTVDTTGANLYVVTISTYSSSAVLPGDLTDVGGNTYTLLTPQTAAGDAKNRVSIFYCVSPITSAVESWKVTDTSGRADNTGICAVALSGCPASPTVTSSQSGATSSTPSAGSLGVAGALVLTAVANYSVDVTSIDSSFAILQHMPYQTGNNIGIALAWQNLSGGVAGAVNPTWTMSGAPTASAVQAISFSATASNFGSAAGAATVTGVGAWTAAAVGNAAGVATVTGVAPSTGNVGSAVGAATVAGVGAWTAAAAGSATAAAIVLGYSAAQATQAIWIDRMADVSTTIGVTAFSLAGTPPLGYQSFAAIPNGKGCYYCAVDPVTGAWEVGRGTYTSAGPSLSRDAVFASSNSGALISWVSGTRTIFGDFPAVRIAPILVNVSGAYVSTPEDGILLCNATGGAITVTLPTAAARGTLPMKAKKVDSSANTVTLVINPSPGTDLIDGATSYVLGSQYAAVTLHSDKVANYFVF